MANDAIGKVKGWLRDVADVTGDAVTGAGNVSWSLAESIRDKANETGVTEKVGDSIEWTKEQLDRAGITAVTQAVAEKTTDTLDTVTGQKIFHLMEERNGLQDKYNDILATKLEEALDRITALEKVLLKTSSS
jgi:hypothetical protein